MSHLERSTSGRSALALGLLLGAGLAPCGLVAAPAAAKADVVASGPCRGAPDSTWKLKVDQEANGSLTVIAAVFSDDTDEWGWKLKHNDDVSAKGSVTARDADRSFRVARSMVDFTGPDEIVFRAGNKDSDEVCRGDVTFNG
ncbi:hypothetical protein [Nocardioides salarius]|uniref:hypothetical protein n=1 Tax=Nocardioides salarius TaxID=374513 RepID=UPI0030F94B95